MKRVVSAWKELAVGLALVLLNGFFVVRLVGLSYTRFNWEAFAQVYDSTPGVDDMDGDGIKDPDDPHPTVFDPTGCFFDLNDGRILSGGSIQVASGDGTFTVNNDGSNGCFQFTATTPGTFTITAFPPPGCGFAANCADQGTFNPPAGTLVALGNPQDPNRPGFLTSNVCTPYYLQITLDADDIGVIQNNIGLNCPRAATPVFSMHGLVLVGIVLAAVGLFGLRRRSEVQG